MYYIFSLIFIIIDDSKKFREKVKRIFLKAMGAIASLNCIVLYLIIPLLANFSYFIIHRPHPTHPTQPAPTHPTHSTHPTHPTRATHQFTLIYIYIYYIYIYIYNIYTHTHTWIGYCGKVLVRDKRST